MYQQPTDFKVEIYFDPNAANLPDICKATDDIFSALNMPCVESGSDRRFYSGDGDPQDFGRLYAAVGKVKRTPSWNHAYDDIKEFLKSNGFE